MKKTIGEGKSFKLKKHQYRLGYDYLFLAHDSFRYKGDFIGSLAINILFKVFDMNGEEIPFESNGLNDQIIYTNERLYYLSDLITCSFDKDELVHIKPNISLLAEIETIDRKTFSWEIDSYTKDILVHEFILEPEKIEKDEFFDIMKNNLNAFNNRDNESAQTTSFFTEEI